MTHVHRLSGYAAIAAVLATSVTAFAAANPAQQALLDKYVAAAKAADASAKGFSAESGKAFFAAKHAGGKPDSPSCTSCHTADPTRPGKSRAGKEIAPMAGPAAATRLTDQAHVEKWFKRNCGDVLGRDCTITEKGDFIAYLLSF